MSIEISASKRIKAPSGRHVREVALEHDAPMGLLYT